jgi:hypothetical protein
MMWAKLSLNHCVCQPVGESIELDILRVTPEERAEMHKELAQILGRFKFEGRVLRVVMLDTRAMTSRCKRKM